MTCAILVSTFSLELLDLPHEVVPVGLLGGRPLEELHTARALLAWGENMKYVVRP